MNRRQAKRLAHHIAAEILFAQLESGEPDTDRWPELSERDIERVRDALAELHRYHGELSDGELP